MRIRRFEPTTADAAALRYLRRRSVLDEPIAFSVSYDEADETPLEAIVEHLQEADVFGAWAEDKLVGMVGVQRAAGAKVRHRATIGGMYVIPEWRGQGVGRALLETALTHTRSLAGVRYATLTVVTAHTTAIALYERAGFRQWGVEPGAIRVDGAEYDLAHMVLDLAEQ
jgi:GNAT superfamily N-acetyltransferase